MNKKGAELSLNVIIIAVVIIFSGRTNIFAKSTQQASQQYTADRCDVPGTGRYCSSQCLEGNYDTGMTNFTCGNIPSLGIGKCCCCKYD